MRGRGAAFLVGRAAGRRSAQMDQEAQKQSSASKSDDQLEKLEKLKKLHEDGTLSDEEFTAAKKKLLEE